MSDRHAPAAAIPIERALTELPNCTRRCLAALREAMRIRHTFAGNEWIEFEREALTNAANTWAISHGLQPVTVAEVEQIEHLAVGHSDYASKLAMYVAEMLYGWRPRT